MSDWLVDVSGIGLAALVVVLGYWLIVRLQSILSKTFERQELLLQKILIAQMSCAKELKEIKESLRISDG